jgi:uncharacterized membrane protein YqgA involved in biofilm formation
MLNWLKKYFFVIVSNLIISLLLISLGLYALLQAKNKPFGTFFIVIGVLILSTIFIDYKLSKSEMEKREKSSPKRETQANRLDGDD